jgi:small conductance mechanosensitive channel
MDLQQLSAMAMEWGTRIGLQILLALVIFLVGRWLIGLAVRVLTAALTRQEVDPTVLRYLGNFISVALNILLVVGILGYFGLETTSFAALIAGVGIAIGAAWGGLLANFAAGSFLIVLRPFKVGDYVAAGGLEGTVDAIGLFATTITTPDNVHTLVGNNRIFSDTIRNYSANPHRRVDRLAQLAHGVDVNDAMARLRAALAAIPNVAQDPPPTVEIMDFSPMGPVLAVRPHCHTNHYWQVYFDTNKAIVSTFGAAGYPVPQQHFRLNAPPPA